MEPPEAATVSRGGSTFTSRALVLLLVVAVLGVSYASSIRAWLNQRSEQNSLAAQIAVQKAQIAELTIARSRWQDPAYIETQARLRFGWVMPGEHSYRVIGKDGKVLGTEMTRLSAPPQPATAGSSPWWDGPVQSLTQADQPPQVKKPAHPGHQPARLIGPAPSGHSGR